MTQVNFLAGPARHRTRHGEPVQFREGLYKLSRDCYAWMVPNGSWGETNIGLIDCNGSSVLIDTCWDLHYTREMLAGLADIVQRSPIGMVINTHADGDHCWGNQLFADKPIIATHACMEQMRHLKPSSVMALQTGCHLLRHVPFGSVGAFGRYMGDMFRPYDFRGVRLTDPNHGFSGEYSMNVKGVDIVVMEVGPGHTDGDAMVYVPDQSAVYAGDIAFVGVTPVMWSGPLDNLVAALHKLLALKASVIVPGHGPLARPQDIDNILSYWEVIQEELYRRFQRDMTPLEAARDVLLGAMYRTSIYAHWCLQERIVTNAFTLYRHWGARLGNLPGPLGVMDILRQQAQLAQEWSALRG